MASPPFVHLHVHSAHSLLVSTVRIGALVDRCRQWDLPAVALTDQGNLFAAIPFFTGCLKAGIKPLFGAQVYLVPDHTDQSQRSDRESRDQLILLCRDRSGWRNLLQLLSLGHLEGSNGKPRIDLGLLRRHAGGLLALSAGAKGAVGRLLADDRLQEAAAAARELAGILDDGCGTPNFYLEVQRHGQPEDDLLVSRTVALAHELNLPLVASADVHFLDPEDQPAQDALLCVGLGATLYQQDRPRFQGHYHFASAGEMARRFQDLPEALANTLQIARRCNVTLELGRPMLPHFKVPDGTDLETHLRSEAEAGLALRLTSQVCPLHPPDAWATVRAQYRQRLEYELDVIGQMGFPGYFLIVSEFIRWAKQKKIPVGPGRGSGAGSLVAWSLDITDLDPIRYQLLFERFLNPERVSMPDFDVDFCMDLREKVIQHVQEFYGADRVAQIITFGTLQARAVIRDVGRVMEFPYLRVDRIAKLIPNVLGISLREAVAQEERLRALMEEEPEVKSLVELALALEGLPRSAGTHAAGVVISDGPLHDTVPLYRDPRSDMPVTQFNMGDVEKAGLVKFDFLGLKTLTVIQATLDMVNPQRQARGEEPIDINRIDLADPLAFRLLKEGRTRGVFQLESSGMREILKKLAPDTLEDVIALVALYRPGPLGSGMVDDFIRRKHGETAVVYPLPQLEPILKETYGVILYQEQVMKIAQVLSGYSLGGADLLRRAMGKKKPEEMASQRATFMEGALRNGIPEKKAESIFDLMEKFAGYGFNKSHSAAYALISYQTTWLKAHYPVAFMAATMTCDMIHTDKLMHFIRECRDMGITVHPPEVNRSGKGFTVEDGGIRYGLAAVKNVGEAAVTALLETRSAGGPFRSLFDLCRRLGQAHLNKRIMEQLIRSGACDTLGGNRNALLLGLPLAMSQGAKRHQQEELGIRDLFSAQEEDEGVAGEDALLPNVPDPDPNTLLAHEKEALGFFLTGHPLEEYKEELDGYGVMDSLTLRERYAEGATTADSPTVRVAALVAERKLHRTRKGDRMAFLTLEDRFGQLEAVVFPDTYQENRERLESDQPLVVEGGVESGEEDPKLTVNRIRTLDEYRAEVCRELRIRANAHILDDGELDRLAELLTRHAGGQCRVLLELTLPFCRATVSLGDAFLVHPSGALLGELRHRFGDQAARFGLVRNRRET
ncbi:MAG: DNA polymerase III subunit alpha [Magnetococcales bacterium]|nr:DNA polymerase III subunit alpha [Magnetococcales bacterium]